LTFEVKSGRIVIMTGGAGRSGDLHQLTMSNKILCAKKDISYDPS
jgi:hypothetical protein